MLGLSWRIMYKIFTKFLIFIDVCLKFYVPKYIFKKQTPVRLIYHFCDLFIFLKSPTSIIFLAGLFFCAYEGVKVFGGRHVSERWDPALHMTAASAGEVVSCHDNMVANIMYQEYRKLYGDLTCSKR